MTKKKKNPVSTRRRNDRRFWSYNSHDLEATKTDVELTSVLVATKPDHNPTKKQPPMKMDFSVFLEFKTNFKSFFSY